MSSSIIDNPLEVGNGPRVEAEALMDGNGRVYDGWKATFASLVGMTLGPSSIVVFCFGVFAPALEREFGWGIGAISFGATLVSLTIVAASLIAGFLVDRTGVRRLVLVSMPLFGLGVALMSLLPASLGLFYAALVLVMLLGAGVGPVAYNKATAIWFDRRLGLSLGLTNVGIGLGAALLPVLVGVLVPAYGWRTAYLVLGLLAVVIPWPLAWAMIKDRKATVGRGAVGSPVAETGLTFAESVRTREFWLSTVGFLVLGTASSTFVIHLVRILVDTGVPAPAAAAMQSVLGVALIAGRLATGWLLDHVRASRVMVILCTAAVAALLLLAAGAPAGTALLCAALGGFVIGAEFDVLGFLIPRYFGRAAFGRIYSCIFAVFQLASAVSIGLLGWWRGSQGSYQQGLWVVAALVAIGVLCFSRLGAYRFAPAAEH